MAFQYIPRQKTREEFEAFYKQRYGANIFDDGPAAQISDDEDDDAALSDAFAAFTDERRWLAWREEHPAGRDKPTKVPYAAHGRGIGRKGLGSSTDSATWGTRAEGEARARQLDDGRKVGCGIVLGDIGDDTFLGGVDLDSCLDENSALAQWAGQILDAVLSYSEISPSDRGLKAFFYLAAEDVRWLLDLISVERDRWGIKRGIPGFSSANHGPAVEVNCSRRYFAVTGRLWSADHPQIVRLERDQLAALAALIPAPAQRSGNGSGSDSDGGFDSSRSGKAWGTVMRMLERQARRAATYEDMCEALRNHPNPEIREWVREKGEPGDEYELHNLWKNARKKHARNAAADDPDDTDRADDDPAGTGGQQHRFELIRFNDITLDTTRPYLVKGLVPREGLTVVWGPPKCCKTFWVFDLVLHVALGWRYRDRRVAQATVVYVACEGERGLRARKEAFRKKHLDNIGRGFADRRNTEDDPPFYLLSTQLNLPGQVGELARDIADQIPPDPVGVIVLDTLNRSLDGSENKDEDMSAYIKAANVLVRQFQCAVIVIHHCGVSETRPRGHTSLTGAAEAQISVQRDSAERIVAEVEYMKDGAEGERIVSKLEVVKLGKDEDGEELTSCVVVEPDDEEIPIRKGTGKLSAPLKIALDQLARAINEKGEVPPDTDGTPPDTMCVLREVWRRYAYDGGISPSGEPEAQRQAFHRASTQLIADKHVGIHGELVWIA